MIGLSGGLDSSVSAKILKDCLKNKVFGLILPERDSDPKNIEDARNLAEELKIETKEINLSPFLRKFEFMNFLIKSYLKTGN